MPISTQKIVSQKSSLSLLQEAKNELTYVKSRERNKCRIKQK